MIEFLVCSSVDSSSELDAPCWSDCTGDELNFYLRVGFVEIVNRVCDFPFEVCFAAFDNGALESVEITEGHFLNILVRGECSRDREEWKKNPAGGVNVFHDD